MILKNRNLENILGGKWGAYTDSYIAHIKYFFDLPLNTFYYVQYGKSLQAIPPGLVGDVGY